MTVCDIASRAMIRCIWPMRLYGLFFFIRTLLK